MILVDGGWTEWSDWTACSKKCGEGGGFKSRIRSCSDPPPLNGGSYCEGDHFDVQPCNDFPCKYSVEKNVIEINEINNEGENFI